jgi:hypothetical protein
MHCFYFFNTQDSRLFIAKEWEKEASEETTDISSDSEEKLHIIRTEMD